MKILIIEDDPTARYAMRRALQSENRIVLEADNGRIGLDRIKEDAPDLVFLDLNMPTCDGMAVLQELDRGSENQRGPDIVVVTADDRVEAAVECIRNGASDFLIKPYDIAQIRAIVLRCEKRIQLERRIFELQTQLERATSLGPMASLSPEMERVFEQVRRAAVTDLPVLIRGESGTGKELVAREIHRLSCRSKEPFIAVNTAAISESLIESELFGHAKGAFTGADRNRDGVFRKANRGTLFLDEIGDMPASVQTRLLRVLQEGIVTPLGTEESIPVDVRIVSATHQNIENAISEKLFRSDLYYRLRGIELNLPPLRNRKEDILLLANMFIANGFQWSTDALTAMVSHNWPGNVRELKQRVQAAVALASGAFIQAVDLGLRSTATSNFAEDDSERSNGRFFDDYLGMPLTEAKEKLANDFERYAIQKVLEEVNGNISSAARKLGIHRQSLQQKLKHLGDD